MNNKKTYETPAVEKVELNVQNVILSSWAPEAVEQTTAKKLPQFNVFN